jgi:hypothetical protein
MTQSFAIHAAEIAHQTVIISSSADHDTVALLLRCARDSKFAHNIARNAMPQLGSISGAIGMPTRLRKNLCAAP